MSIGIRHFVVDGENIEKISQKNRQGFYIKQENSLSKYAGLDKEYEKDHIKHIGNIIEPPQINGGKEIIEAADFFEAKKLKNKYSWKLSDEVVRKIADALKV